MKHHPSSLELLESRIAPASLVTVGFDHGKLTITGDDAANAITVFATSATTFRVMGSPFSLLAPETNVQVGAGAAELYHDFSGSIKAIEFMGKAGQDTLNLTELKFASLNFDGGADSDTLNLTNVNVKGDVNVEMKTADPADLVNHAPELTQNVNIFGAASLIGGKLAMMATGTALDPNGGGGLHFTSLAGSTTVNGSFNFTGTPNNDSATIGSFFIFTPPAGLIKIGKETVVTDTESFSFAAKTVSLGKNALGKSGVFTGGAAADTFTLQGNASLTTTGSVDFTGGGGGDLVTLTGSTIHLGKNADGKSLNLAQTGAQSSLTTTVTASVLASFAGYVAADGTGTSLGFGLNLNGGFIAGAGSIAVGKSAAGKSIDFKGGTGADTLSLNAISAVTLAGGLAFDSTPGLAGTLSVTAANGAVSIGKTSTGQSLDFKGAAGGIAAGSIFGETTTSLKGSVEVAGVATTLNLGRGAFEASDTLSLGKNAAGKSVVLTTTGYAFVNLGGDSATVAGSVEIRSGGSQVALTSTNKLSIGQDTAGQSVTDTGSAGDDSLNLAARSLSIAGRVSFTGAAGSDSVSIVGDGTIKGAVTLDLGTASIAAGGAPQQSVFLSAATSAGGGLKLAGPLSVTSTSTDVSDHLTMKGIDLAKAVTLTLGNGANQVDINNIFARVSLALTTGAGADIVNIETDHTFGGAIIKNADLKLGGGDDVFTVGGTDAASDKVFWTGTSQIDAGANNTANPGDKKVIDAGSSTGLTQSGFES